MKKLTTFTLASMLAGCTLMGDSDYAVSQTAERWAEAFFSCNYHEAEQLSTPESGRWLRFAASNTTQQDLDILAQHTVEAEADTPSAVNDTLRTLSLTVRNYLMPAAIGDSVKQLSQGIFHVTMVKRDGRWLVRMEGLPRSEMQSHD